MVKLAHFLSGSSDDIDIDPSQAGSQSSIPMSHEKETIPCLRLCSGDTSPYTAKIFLGSSIRLAINAVLIGDTNNRRCYSGD